MAERTALLETALVEVVEACAAVNVEPLVLKGVALSRTLYRSDESRVFFDVDLLIAEEDLARVGQVLERLGYRNISELQGVDDVAEILHAQMWARLEPDFGNVSIDLHWRLNGCEAPPQHVWQALSDRRESIEVAGISAHTLDRPGLALHLALHMAQHGRDDEKARADLMRGLERWPPETWGEARNLAAEVGAMDAFAAGLRLVPDGALLADQMGLPAAEALLWEIDHRGERPRGTFHMQAFSEARGVGAKLELLRLSLLPRRDWIIWQHPNAADSRVRLLAAYVLHLLRAPVWAARAWRFRRRTHRG